MGLELELIQLVAMGASNTSNLNIVAEYVAVAAAWTGIMSSKLVLQSQCSFECSVIDTTPIQIGGESAKHVKATTA
jgi:hypothetical protein